MYRSNFTHRNLLRNFSINVNLWLRHMNKPIISILCLERHLRRSQLLSVHCTYHYSECSQICCEATSDCWHYCHSLAQEPLTHYCANFLGHWRDIGRHSSSLQPRLAFYTWTMIRHSFDFPHVLFVQRKQNKKRIMYKTIIITTFCILDHTVL